MEIKKLVVGNLQENCYIVTKNGKSLIIDPGDEAERIIMACDGLDVVEVLVTHHHFDHIGALDAILKKYNIKENVKSGYFTYEVIETPGHTSDSKTFYFKEDKIMFSGDFLFLNSIGRTDLETGSDYSMHKSLDIISEYPDDVVVYPGHGSKTVLGHEKLRFNLYY